MSNRVAQQIVFKKNVFCNESWERIGTRNTLSQSVVVKGDKKGSYRGKLFCFCFACFVLIWSGCHEYEYNPSIQWAITSRLWYVGPYGEREVILGGSDLTPHKTIKNIVSSAGFRRGSRDISSNKLGRNLTSMLWTPMGKSHGQEPEAAIKNRPHHQPTRIWGHQSYNLEVLNVSSRPCKLGGAAWTSEEMAAVVTNLIRLL